jgi:hypothetical protein
VLGLRREVPTFLLIRMVSPDRAPRPPRLPSTPHHGSHKLAP